MTRAATWHPHHRDRTWTTAGPSPEALTFHRALPGYSPTPLVELPTLAAELGIGRLFAKDESLRLGLPAFKALGASWAVHRAVEQHARPDGGPLTVVSATDGNHGRAVARFALQFGHRARIWVPRGVHPAAVAAIENEGAPVTAVDGSYDDAVAAAARAADEPGVVLVQDTAWEGYQQIPGWIVDGYGTLFTEVDDQLGQAGCGGTDLVVVPVGVGALAQAALAHWRSATARLGTAVVTVEPDSAACVLASLAAGRLTTVDTGETIMAGLNCGTPSSQAWPYLVNGLDGAVAVSDAADEAAAGDLAALSVAAGPCGAAGLAAVRALLTGPDSGQSRSHLRIGTDGVAVLLVTEGSDANPALSQ